MTTREFATLLHQLGRLTRRAMGERMVRERWAVDAGFRPGCVVVLRTVAVSEPVSQRVLGQALGFDPSDLVSLVDVLDRAGLVERRRDPADRRRHSLEITQAGRQAAWRLEQVVQDVDDVLLAPLDAGERELLADLLGRVVEHHARAEAGEDGAETRPATPVEASRQRGRDRGRAAG